MAIRNCKSILFFINTTSIDHSKARLALIIIGGFFIWTERAVVCSIFCLNRLEAPTLSSNVVSRYCT